MESRKRAYQHIFKDEYKNEPPCIGFPLVILVDDSGKSESISDFSSLDIYEAIRKGLSPHFPLYEYHFIYKNKGKIHIFYYIFADNR